jgi:hypothetical protein
MKKLNQNQGIEELSTALLGLLESKGYGSGTLVNYRRMLLRINLFMQRRKIVKYTESVGKCFLAEYLTKKTYSVPYRQVIKTTLRRLNELNNGDDY